MSREQQDELRREFRQVLREALTPMFEGTGVPIDKTLEDICATPMWKKIEANIDKVPESEKTKFRANKLKIIYKIREQLTKGVKNIPHSPGGRPKLLTDGEKRAACKEVLRLVGEGMDLSEALLQVSRRKGISLTTMRRYWRARQHLGQQDEK
jgi:hypothetical protein